MSQPLIPILRKHALIFASFLVLYEFLTYIANDMIMPGMIGVVRSFHAPEADVATSLIFYMLGGASLQVVLGPVSDAYGRRPMMLLGASLFFIFTVLIAGSNSMNQFLVARFFQGMGLCFIGVIGYATIQEIFAEMDAIRIIAVMANISILAPLVGPLLGAIIIHYASWRWIFIMIALGSILALWGLWRYMPEPIGQMKNDGEKIEAAPLSFIAVFQNYKKLLANPVFCFGTIALSLLSIPCMAWIALSPIILISQAKLTVIQYGLWQIPVFGATILGNWALHHLTYKYKIKPIIFLGSLIMSIGLIITALLPYFFGTDYKLLLPGFIIYFFSLSLIHAPLNRFCLYVTSVSKGTASALISLTTMIVGALGIGLANKVYSTHINLDLAVFCNVTGLFFLFFIALSFLYGQTKTKVC